MTSWRLSLAWTLGRPLAFLANWSRRVASSSAATILRPSGDWKKARAGAGSLRLARNWASARLSTAWAWKRWLLLLTSAWYTAGGRLLR
ncbi:hypothetical protein D3C76_1612180 [compost metagenome]